MICYLFRLIMCPSSTFLSLIDLTDSRVHRHSAITFTCITKQNKPYLLMPKLIIMGRNLVLNSNNVLLVTDWCHFSSLLSQYMYLINNMLKLSLYNLYVAMFSRCKSKTIWCTIIPPTYCSTVHCLHRWLVRPERDQHCWCKRQLLPNDPWPYQTWPIFRLLFSDLL